MNKLKFYVYREMYDFFIKIRPLESSELLERTQWTTCKANGPSICKNLKLDVPGLDFG